MRIACLFSIILLVSCTQKPESKEKNRGNESQTPPIIEAVAENNPSTHDGFVHEKIDYLWETDPIMKTPESVILKGEFIYVSNINGGATEKNGQGFISQLAKDGSIIKEKWAEGLNAPKGMGINKNSLFVTDIDRVVELDLGSGGIINEYPLETAGFLNDIDISKEGDVYISDYTESAIYKLSQGKIELWLQDKELKGVNGLYVEGNYLMAGTDNDIYRIDIYSKNIKLYIEGSGPVDGLEAYGDGRWVYSDWAGHIYIAGPDTKKIMIIDTSLHGIQAADIWFVVETKCLYVPTFRDNRVMAYKLKC